jgi:hypothetical protein
MIEVKLFNLLVLLELNGAESALHFSNTYSTYLSALAEHLTFSFKCSIATSLTQYSFANILSLTKLEPFRNCSFALSLGLHFVWNNAALTSEQAKCLQLLKL